MIAVHVGDVIGHDEEKIEKPPDEYAAHGEGFEDAKAILAQIKAVCSKPPERYGEKQRDDAQALATPSVGCERLVPIVAHAVVAGSAATNRLTSDEAKPGCVTVTVVPPSPGVTVTTRL